jgi:hypothetical protein
VAGLVALAAAEGPLAAARGTAFAMTSHARRLHQLRSQLCARGPDEQLPPALLAAMADRGWPFREQVEDSAARLRAAGQPVTPDSLLRDLPGRKHADLKAGRMYPWYCNDLLSGQYARPAGRAELLATDYDRLAAACTPACLGYAEAPPALWGAREWAGLAASAAEPLFDMVEVRRQHAAQGERYARDGFAVFEGVMTAASRRRWVAALQEVQRLNDNLLRADWAALDWSILRPGGRRPVEALPAADRLACIGSAGCIPNRSDIAGVSTLRRHAVLPEYFPAGHVPFVMQITTHPDMLALQRLCLGSSEIFFGQSQLSNVKPGTHHLRDPSNSGWHSHWTGGGQDGDDGVPSVCPDPAEYMAGNLQNLTLSYPNGFATADDGNISVVPGSHLWRDPDNCRGRMLGDDGEVLVDGWLHGKHHPVTGAPLAAKQLRLAPGSLVCMNSHVAHYVGPVGRHRPPRLALSSFYFRRSARTGTVQPPAWLPPLWARKAECGMLPEPLNQLLQNAVDAKLTGGRCIMQQN